MGKDWRERTSARPKLLTELYESVLYPRRMGAALANINRHLDCDGVHLVGWDARTGDALVSVVTDDHIATAEKVYLEHYAAIDPRREMGQRTPHGKATACHDFFDDQYVAQSEFYQDFLIPLGPRYIAGGSIHRSDEKQAHLVFNHLVGRPKFEGKKRKAIEAWLPQLTSWMDQVLRAEELRQAAAFGDMAIDAMDGGVAFFDERGQLLHATSAATTWLGGRVNRVNLGLTGLGPHGSSLDAVVSEVARTRQAVHLTLSEIPGRPALSLSLVPVARERLAGEGGSVGRLASAAPHLPGLHHRASVVLTVRPIDAGKPTLVHLTKSWRLTPAEFALARALINGKSVAEHASAQHVKVSTIRTHVRSLLEKSGCKSMRAWLASVGYQADHK